MWLRLWYRIEARFCDAGMLNPNRRYMVRIWFVDTGSDAGGKRMVSSSAARVGVIYFFRLQLTRAIGGAHGEGMAA